MCFKFHTSEALKCYSLLMTLALVFNDCTHGNTTYVGDSYSALVSSFDL